jgi:hypothetical protein
MESNEKKEYKIPLTEILKEIEKFKIINKIIEMNIHIEDLNISNIDIANFKITIQYLLKHDVKQNLKYVAYNYSNYIFMNQITEEDKQYFLKQFLLLITFLNHYSGTIKLKEYNLYELLNMTLKLIRKLYYNKIFGLKEISIITKYTLILSLFRNVINDTAIRVNKSVKNVLVWVAITFFANLWEQQSQEIIYEEVNSFVEEILNFFNEKFLNSASNLTFLSNTLIPLSLLEITKIDKLSKENRDMVFYILGRIYENSFDFEFYTHIMAKLRTGLVNLTNKKPHEVIAGDIKLLDGYIELLKCLNSLNKKNSLNEPYYITHGFNFTSPNNTGIILQPMLSFPEKGYTLTFSFKWIPEGAVSSRISLISFIADKQEKPFNKKEDFKDFILFSIFIEDSRLCIATTKETWKTSIQIEPMHNYLVTVTQAEIGLLKKRSHINVLINNNIFEEGSILGYPSGKMKCLVGYLLYFSEGFGGLATDNYFTGNIGTIMLFNKLFPLTTIQMIHDMKKDYEKALFLNYTTYISTEKKSEALFRLKNNKTKFDENLFMIISAKVIYL